VLNRNQCSLAVQTTAQDAANITFRYTSRATAGGIPPANARLLTCVLPHARLDAGCSAPAALRVRVSSHECLSFTENVCAAAPHWCQLLRSRRPFETFLISLRDLFFWRQSYAWCHSRSAPAVFRLRHCYLRGQQRIHSLLPSWPSAAVIPGRLALRLPPKQAVAHIDEEPFGVQLPHAWIYHQEHLHH